MLIDRINCVKQTCVFQNYSWNVNGYDGAAKSYYQCRIDSVNLLIESEDLTTDTTANSRSNLDVESIYYTSGNLKYIPNSLFTLFPNAEYFTAGSSNMVNLKSHYFKNALKLKVIWINNSKIKNLDANSFIEVINLEYLRLVDNEIESIHRLAFSGLTQLKGLYLDNNKISNLHPFTFSKLTKLQVLIMTGGSNCLMKKFTQPNTEIKQIELKIRISCTYEFFTDSDAKILDKNTVDIMQQQQVILNLTAKIEMLEKIIMNEAATKKEMNELHEACNKNIINAETGAMESFFDILKMIEVQAIMDEKIIAMTSTLINK